MLIVQQPPFGNEWRKWKFDCRTVKDLYKVSLYQILRLYQTHFYFPNRVRMPISTPPQKKQKTKQNKTNQQTNKQTNKQTKTTEHDFAQ